MGKNQADEPQDVELDESIEDDIPTFPTEAEEAAAIAAEDNVPVPAPPAGHEYRGPLNKEKIKGVFSTQSVEKVGTGTTVRKTIQKMFWMAEEQDDGSIQIQPLNVTYVPSGPKRKIPKEDLLKQFNPEPEFYVQSVYPALRKLNQTIELGEDHRKKGRNFSAEFEFNSALAVDVENVRANFGLGLTYLERGESKKADNIFERLVKLDAAFEPEHKHLFNEFGINLRKTKMYDQAIDYYERALILTRGDENIHYNIARAYFAKQQVAKTVEHLQTVQKMNAEHQAAGQFLEWLKTKGFLAADGAVTPNPPGWSFEEGKKIDNADANSSGPASYKMDI